MGQVTTGSKLKKNMPTLIILIISGALIYALPYFRSYYYDAFVECFGITNTQMGALGSAFGGFSVFAYFLGGFCADRWPARHLMTISLVTTGICGFVLLLFPPYPVVFAIHCIWGITSILTFWSALVKAIRSLANSDEQGKAFGFFEGGRGIVNMVQSAIVLALFGYLAKVSTDKTALSAVIIIYSVICVLLGILVFFMFKEPARSEGEEGPKKLFDMKILKRVAKMPTTWLQILIIFCSYAMIISYFYITPYATSVFGTSAVIAAALGYFSQYCRPVGCFASGIFADKFGSSKILSISYVVMIIGIFGIIFTPGQPSMIWMLLVFIAAIYASMYAIQSMHFAIMEEGNYPLEITGTATAIITPIGYSAEFFMPVIGGMCLDR
ncbi:MFS transporter [Ruminococcus gauvreauii]|uniref:MFS transporter n=1 Tax=Ruminococcus gauvreauii TaxID=438033 RepID=A0ABY5VL13_9FIRM|nr:MFS transporter [Ruminococcus gauvreauii]UWP60901.1 MFS transporter [Ruminococcus gauvreauii]